MNQKLFYWERFVSLLTVLLILSGIALQKNGTLNGRTAHELTTTDDSTKQQADTIQIASDGTLTVNTAFLANDIVGYGGPTPLRISVKEGVITQIAAGDNTETPDFFSSATEQIFPKYIGKPIEEAANLHVDAVAGATYSSSAIIGNMGAGLNYLQAHTTDLASIAETGALPQEPWSAKNIIAIIVILIGGYGSLFYHGKGFRLVQLALNVAVLGCWCGTFISYSLIVNYLSNGIHIATAVPVVLMLIVAMIMPLFGKSRHYCLWLCPLGSAQELIYRLIPFKANIPVSLMVWLSRLRWTIWSTLMVLALVGVWFEWMNYELFAIFFIRQASWVVVALAIVFGLLSIAVSRPYCRFLCPTGCLLQTIENKKLDSQM